MHPFELRSRRHPEKTHLFLPEDHLELWKLTNHPDKGLSALRDADQLAVADMFILNAVR